MLLVSDTNIVFSLFKKDSFTNRLLKEHEIKLFAPMQLIKQLHKYSADVCSKAKISEEKFLQDISLLPELIELKEPLPSFESKASKLISHESDVPFLALALELNIPIWSNDDHFKEQSEIPVFKTYELKKFLDEE